MQKLPNLTHSFIITNPHAFLCAIYYDESVIFPTLPQQRFNMFIKRYGLILVYPGNIQTPKR